MVDVAWPIAAVAVSVIVRDCILRSLDSRFKKHERDSIEALSARVQAIDQKVTGVLLKSGMGIRQ
jgi:hypothetical protein